MIFDSGDVSCSYSDGNHNNVPQCKFIKCHGPLGYAPDPTLRLISNFTDPKFLNIITAEKTYTLLG